MVRFTEVPVCTSQDLPPTLYMEYPAPYNSYQWQLMQQLLQIVQAP